MADDFANGRNFFDEIRLDSHFLVSSFAGGQSGWPLPSWKEAMMLSVCWKGEYLTGTLLSPAEDGAMRKAFGRFATPDARAAGADVVQRRGTEKWFRCDCLDGLAARPPMLIPVMESFIRRHTDPPWPAHAESCDFFREPAEQRVITKSYGPPSPAPLHLVRRYGQAEGPAPVLEVYRSYAWRREGLATMLRLLQIRSGLNRVASPFSRPKLGDQYRMLRGAAADIEIDDNLPLSRFLCTYAPALPEFMEKVGAAPEWQFKTTRPHGIFLTVINGVADGHLLVNENLTVPVRGRISVFGESDGHKREMAAERSARAPYLAACLVARPKAVDPVCLMKAYVHPVASVRDLMLVDSNYERRTLAELKRLQQFLSSKWGIRMAIEKPMFDIKNAEDLDDPGVAAREPCIPDFILRADPVSAGRARVVIVETMGFASETYRSRKAVTHEIMASTLNARVVSHDFHFPAALTQVERDQHFLSSARWAVTSPEENPRGSHPGAGPPGAGLAGAAHPGAGPPVAGPPVAKSPAQSQPARSVGSGRGQLKRRQRCASTTL